MSGSNEAQVRAFALSLPGAVEKDHHGFPSFRVKGKIFATLPDPHRLHVMLEEPDIHAAIERDGRACEGQMWGKKLAALRVDLRLAGPKLVEGWLTDAWERRAEP